MTSSLQQRLDPVRLEFLRTGGAITTPQVAADFRVRPGSWDHLAFLAKQLDGHRSVRAFASE